MSGLNDLGRHVAALQDADLAVLRSSERAGESFIRAVRQRARPAFAPRFPARLVGLAALALTLALVVVGWLGQAQSDEPAPLVVTPAVSVGDAIRAPREQSIPLHFSDGSEVRLTSGAEASVRRLTSHGATVALTHGTARVSVKHHPETKWSLQAGPYAVRVTGTRFELAWSPDERRFSLDLWEGSVQVSSDGREHSVVEMVAPERLVIDAGGWHLSRAEGGASASSEPEPSDASAPQVAAAEPPAEVVAKPAQEPRVAAAAKSWERLAGQGDYAAAFEVARAQGIGGLSRSGSASQLLALAETCRLSGHTDEGVAVLSRLRARFPASEESSVAAIQLGRLMGGGAASARWFQAYLNERPNGRLAREALGRLMEALERSGARAEAQRAATRYRARYPSGPHARFAARLLGD